MFDEVIVAVMHNPAKSGSFDVPTRIDFIEQSLPHFVAQTATVRVEAFADQLLADVCRRSHAQWIVKGLRGPTDYSYEIPMARMNRHMAGVETVFLPADPRLEHVSSSLVREIAAHGADVAQWVPQIVATALQAAPSDPSGR